MDEERASRRGRTVSRRRLMQLLGAAALLGACRPPASPLSPSAPPPTPASTPATTTPSPTPSRTPTARATPTPTATATATPSPTPTARPAALARVALAQAESYEPSLVRRQVQALLDGLGGLQGVVGSGDRVAIKVNLTGGSYYQPPAGLAATESYMTHPEVVRALAELLRDAGAREVLIVEALFDAESYRRYGYEEMAQALGATLVDLNRPDPHADFGLFPLGTGGLVYDQFAMHRLLQEADVLISAAKMKTHCRCGVTLSLKNLVGLVPAAHYRLSEQHWHRSALHGATNEETRTRLPRVVVDLCRARPIDLALIDGIRTCDGGEVPRGSFAPLAAGVLVAARDPVAADAVATAVMGHDPTAGYPDPPFVNADNHLELARQAGLGTNRLEQIEVVGARVEDVRRAFRPCWSEEG